MDHVFTYTQGTRGSHVRTGCRTGARCDTVAYLYISTTKTFITIPSTGATPKPLHAIKSGRQRALASCDQLNPHNSRSKSEKQKYIPRDRHFFGATITVLGRRSTPKKLLTLSLDEEVDRFAQLN